MNEPSLTKHVNLQTLGAVALLLILLAIFLKYQDVLDYQYCRDMLFRGLSKDLTCARPWWLIW